MFQLSVILKYEKEFFKEISLRNFYIFNLYLSSIYILYVYLLFKFF